MALDTFTAADIARIEDQIHGVVQKLREIRREMTDSGPDQVEWNFGTFVHYVSELEERIITAKADWDKYKKRHATKADARAKRELLARDRKKKA